MILLYFRISGAGSPRIAPSHTPYWQAWRMQRARGTRTFVPSHAYGISTSHPYGIYVCDLEAARMWRWRNPKPWKVPNPGKCKIQADAKSWEMPPGRCHILVASTSWKRPDPNEGQIMAHAEEYHMVAFFRTRLIPRHGKCLPVALPGECYCWCELPTCLVVCSPWAPASHVMTAAADSWTQFLMFSFVW